MASEAQRRAAQKYKAKSAKQYSFCFLRDKDSDIIAQLDAIGNKQGYIKALIRADIARANSTQPAQNIMKEDNTTKYNPTPLPASLPIDPQYAGLLIRDDQDPDETDPGVPSGGSPWYAVVQNDSDDWSHGSFDLQEALRIARNLEGAKILEIDNTLDYPFISEEIDPNEI